VKFLDNILQRNGPGLAVVSEDELETLQTAISLHHARLGELEAERLALEGQLAEVSSLSARLKIAASEGQESAHVSLDNLAREELILCRRHEGLQSRIVELRQELQPELARAAALEKERASQRNRERREREMTEARERCTRLTEEILAAWRLSCVKAYQIATLLDEGVTRAIREPEDEIVVQSFRTLSGDVSKTIFSGEPRASE
jgi:chromosome segregation ATPase